MIKPQSRRLQQKCRKKYCDNSDIFSVKVTFQIISVQSYYSMYLLFFFLLCNQPTFMIRLGILILNQFVGGLLQKFSRYMPTLKYQETLFILVPQQVHTTQVDIRYIPATYIRCLKKFDSWFRFFTILGCVFRQLMGTTWSSET